MTRFPIRSLLVLALMISACHSGLFVHKDRNSGPPREGLFAHWPLDERQGDVVADRSGNGRDGALTAPESWQPSLGRYSGALHLRDNTHAVFEDTEEWMPGERMSVSLWLKSATHGPPLPDDAQPRVPIVSKGDGAFSVWLNVKEGEILFRCGTESAVAAMVPISDGAWHHVVAANNGARLLLYVDGEIAQTTVAKAVVGASPHPISIGAHPGSTQSYTEFSGLVDDVLLYDRALGANEVRSLAADHVPPPPDRCEPSLAPRKVTLRGKVADPSGVKSLMVDGQPVEIAPDGAWELQIEVETPDPMVTFTATDTLDNVSTTTVRIGQQNPGTTSAERTGSRCSSESHEATR